MVGSVVPDKICQLLPWGAAVSTEHTKCWWIPEAMNWLSIRVREGRIFRNSQGYGKWVFHRLRKQCWSDLGRAKWMKSSEHQ